MKIVYTATNRAHHYPLATELHRQGSLECFVSGFSRFSPRAGLPELNGKLLRADYLQTLYLLASSYGLPDTLIATLNKASNAYIDKASLVRARSADAFVYYRTTGIRTARSLRREGSMTLTIMEEVNSHVDECAALMKAEYDALGLGRPMIAFPDRDLRLQGYDECDAILCPSEFVRQSFLKRGFAPERIIKVPFGCPQVPVFSNLKGQHIEDDVFRILFVGQIHFRKGLRYLVEAFKKIKHPRKELVLVGPKTSVTGLERTILPEGIVFTGVLKGLALEKQYRKASVFVLPSVEEGMALVQCEALGYGLPLVTTLNTGGDDLIDNGIQGFVLAPAQVDLIAESLQLLADDPSLRASMAYAARQRAEMLGGWPQSVKLLIEQLEALKTRLNR